MKELVCRHSNSPNLEEKFGRNKDVLKEHNIENVYLILDTEFGRKVLPGFFYMVGFDCLIGHGDRHWSNYGVVVDETDGNLKYKFSPIYDTASGYLLEINDNNKLRKMLVERQLDDENWYKPKKKPLCKMICNNDLKTNHIELFEHILDNQDFQNYTSSLIDPVKRFNINMVRSLLKNNFYLKSLSDDRKFAIIKVLEMRKKILDSIIDQKYKKVNHVRKTSQSFEK